MAGSKITADEAEEKTRARLIADTTAIIAAVLPKPKRTLDDILTDIQDVQDGLRQFEPGDIDDLKSKVDAYKKVDEAFDLEILRVEREIERLEEVKGSLETNQEGLRKALAFHMEAHGYKKLPGELNQLTLVTRKDVELTLPEPTVMMFRHYPELMKHHYTWNKIQVKNVVLGDPDKWKKWGKVKEKKHVQFTLRKGLKNE